MAAAKDESVPVSFTDSDPKLAHGTVTPTRSSKEEEAGNLQDEPAGPALGDERKIVGFRWALAVLSMLSSTFLFALDTTVVADIQPNIINSFGEFEKFAWLGAGFVLPVAALNLPFSKAYSLFDIKYLYIGFVTIFEIGSALSGAAPTMNALIVGRIIAGVGGCGMYVGGLTFLSVVTSVEERPFYISLVTPVWGIGTVLGPIVGGAFAESKATWRWGFYINLVIYALFVPIYVFILPSMSFSPNLSMGKKLAKFDWLGLVVFTGFCVSFIMALQFGGTTYGWKSGSEIALWSVAGATAIGFVLTQIFHPFVESSNKFYPAHMLKNWRLAILQWATASGSAAVYIPIYYIPLFFQFAKGDAPLISAVRLLPFVFAIVILSLLNGFYMQKLGYYAPWFFVGGIFGLIGGVLMFTVTSATSNAAVYGYSVILGIGGGCLLMSAFGCVSDVVKLEDVFDAIGVLSICQGFGIVFFVSGASIIFQNLGVKYIKPFLPADYSGDPHSILGGTSNAVFQSLPAETRGLISEGIVKALSMTYALTIAATALTVLITPFIYKRTLRSS
ncbi:major facilitator superfamily domain-containing protein [Leptodontidium sp. 2 PMI_412]|nr:major facilitator superfamily domain-containing protein [Leptodontidium sp. 2 PMI_412]